MGTVEHSDDESTGAAGADAAYVPVRQRWARYRPDHPVERTDFLAPAAVVVALIATAAWIGRRLWFFSDDWNIFTDYTSGNLSVPFNGHLSAVPVGIYQGLFHTAGMGSYWPYRIVGLVGLAVLGFQVVRWCGVRLAPPVAAIAVAAIMWNSSGTTNVLFPFLINFSLPIAALVAIWWHLDRLGTARPLGGRKIRLTREPATTFPIHEVAISLWLALALATSGLGVMAAVAVLVELVLRTVTRRTWKACHTWKLWRIWLAWAVPVCVWLGWWVGHRESNEISTEVTQVVPYFLRMLWGGPSSIAAGNKVLGAVLGLLLLAWVVAASLRARRLDPRVAGALTAALAFAALTSLTRQGTFPPIVPDEPRYAWTIGAYLVLAAVAQATALRGTATDPPTGTSTDVADGPRAPRRTAPSWYGTTFAVCSAIGVVVLLVGAARLVDAMGEWTDTVAGAAPGLRSNLYAAEAVGAQRMSPESVIAPLSFLPVSAEAYLDAVGEVGSPIEGVTASEIGGRRDQLTAADELFFDNVRLDPPEPQAASFEEGLPGCSIHAEASPGSSVLIVAPWDTAQPGGAAISVSRFERTGAHDNDGLRVDTPPGVSRLELPKDAPVAADASIPYQLSGIDGAVFCPQ